MGDFAWHFSIQFEAACANGYAAPYLQWPDWSGTSVSDDVGSFAVDLKRSAFEMRLNKKFLEQKLGTEITKLFVFVASAKPGEPTGAWGEWVHTFDPDEPGGPGEAVGGSDFADYMPDDALDVRTGVVRGPLIEVELAPAPPEVSPPPPPPPGPPVELIAGVIIAVVVVVAVAVLFLLRKKR